jgi:tRNA-splicing ligase RtcB (3'-phosphate/5'-hydroxy nucleic acid ligase)
MARDTVAVFGTHDARTVAQLNRCVSAERGARAVLCADGHVGYSMPIGGVVAYRRFISPSGVGYDIACGNLAARTDVRAADVGDWRRVADEIQQQISFGIGRANSHPIDEHPVFDRIARSPVREQRGLLQLARQQLGTVGSGNHYVDLLEDEEGDVWIGVHFGSRGFGHRTATGFMRIAQGGSFDDGRGEGEMDAPPLLLAVDAPGGQDYLEAMTIAGEYAYAGREAVVERVRRILGANVTESVHNHHNFAWREIHDGEPRVVVRKGATPAFPGQRGFVGGSMGDISVILEGVESSASRAALYSTIHGAGRVMSRTQAAGRRQRRTGKILKPGAVDWPAAQRSVRERGVVLRGGGPDEAPQVYRRLDSVLSAHAGTVRVLHRLQPRVVVMAGMNEFDPYKD